MRIRNKGKALERISSYERGVSNSLALPPRSVFAPLQRKYLDRKPIKLQTTRVSYWLSHAIALIVITAKGEKQKAQKGSSDNLSHSSRYGTWMRRSVSWCCKDMKRRSVVWPQTSSRSSPGQRTRCDESFFLSSPAQCPVGFPDSNTSGGNRHRSSSSARVVCGSPVLAHGRGLTS